MSRADVAVWLAGYPDPQSRVWELASALGVAHLPPYDDENRSQERSKNRWWSW